MEKRRTDQVLVNKNFLLVLFALIIVLVIVSAVLLGVVVSDRKDAPQQAENQIPIVNEQTPAEITTESLTQPTGVGSYRVNTTADALNMRAEPSADAEIVTTIPKGTIVSVSATTGEWGYVTYQEASGWVSMRYLISETTATGAASAANSAG